MLKAQTGRSHLSVAIADHQTAGKGREQRQWISEKGHRFGCLYDLR